MADKTINELTAATTMGNDDLLVLQQGGTAKKLSGKQLGDYVYNAAAEKVAEVNKAVDDARSSINDIVESVQSMTELGTDTTLTTTGMAADAKAAGDKIKAVETAAMADLSQGTASGSIVTITDGADNMPIKKMTVDIEPVQEGTGDPSPDNIRPISGRTGAKLYKYAQNLYNKDANTANRYIDESGTWKSVSTSFVTELIPCKPNVQYYHTRVMTTSYERYMAFYMSDKSTLIDTKKVIYAGSFVTPQNAYYMRFSLENAYAENFCVSPSPIIEEVGNFNCNIYDITFPSEAGTVYGGKLEINEDGSGTLTVDKRLIVYDGSSDEDIRAGSSTAEFTLYGAPGITAYTSSYKVADIITNYLKPVAQSSSWKVAGIISRITGGRQNFYCRINAGSGIMTAEEARAYLQEHPLELLYNLATPVEYQLTEAQITTLLGTNNIWADTGDIAEFVYRKAPIDSSDIDEKIAEIEPIIAGRETSMTATKNYSSGGLVIVDHTLYKLDANVASGETFAPGTNCYITTVEDELAECVPSYRSVNDKVLFSDVTLSAEDIPYDDSLSEHTSGSVGEAVSDLKESSSFKVTPSMIDGKFVTNAGVVGSSVIYSVSDYLLINDSIRIDSIYAGVSPSYCIVYYNANREFISAQSVSGSGARAELVKLNPPTDAVYVRFDNNKNTLSSSSVYLICSFDAEKYYEVLKANIKTTFTDSYLTGNALLENVIGVISKPNNLVDYSECTDNAYVETDTGNLHVASAYFATGFIPVTEGTKYRANVGRNFAWYDVNKTYLSGTGGTSIQTEVTAPENASYIRFTINKSTDGISDPFKLYFAEKTKFNNGTFIPDLQINGYYYGKTINWLGDSIVAGNFDGIVTSVLGLTENDYGINGSTIALAEDETDDRNACVARYSTMTNDADIIAVSCGTNDFEYAWCPIGTIDDADDGTSNNTFYGALKTLCKGLITKYPQKTIFFTTPIKRGQPFENGAGGTYTQDGVTLTPFSKNKYGKTLGDYADIIKEVCGYYSIPVLDLYRESMLNPSITAQQNMFDNVLTHPNAAGQAMMAKRICGWLTQLSYNIS